MHSCTTSRLDWMEIEVRDESRRSTDRFDTGDAVQVSWDIDAVSVVAD